MPVVKAGWGATQLTGVGRWLWRAGAGLAPAYAVLVGFIIHGRATSRATDPLPWLLGQPIASTIVGCLDLAAHLWLFAAVVWVWREAGYPFPSLRAIRTSLGARNLVVLMVNLGLVLAEHLPRGVWR